MRGSGLPLTLVATALASEGNVHEVVCRRKAADGQYPWSPYLSEAGYTWCPYNVDNSIAHDWPVWRVPNNVDPVQRYFVRVTMYRLWSKYDTEPFSSHQSTGTTPLTAGAPFNKDFLNDSDFIRRTCIHFYKNYLHISTNPDRFIDEHTSVEHLVSASGIANDSAAITNLNWCIANLGIAYKCDQ